MYCADPEENLDSDEETAEFVNRFRKLVGINSLKVGDF